MYPKNDIRVIKTHQALTSSFFQLLSERKFEEITIHALCERAGIRRATFYKHFSDKYDFFGFIMRQQQARYDAASGSPANDFDLPDYCVRICKYAISFFEENQHLVAASLESKMLPRLFDIVSEQLTSDILQKIQSDIHKGRQCLVPPEILAPFLCGALIHALHAWVTSPLPKVSKDHLVTALDQLFHRMTQSIYLT